MEKAAEDETFPSHPIYLFKQENRQIEKRTAAIKDLTQKSDKYDLASFTRQLDKLLNELIKIDIHYERKEQLLFPFLEKQGFMGPSKVMWGKDNEIRDMLKTALKEMKTMKNKAAQTLTNRLIII